MLRGTALLAVALAAGSATAEPARFVIAVGFNGGGADPRPALSYADDDAARMFRTMLPAAEKAWLLTTFDKESTRAFPHLSGVARAPTQLELARTMGEVQWQVREARRAGRDTELVFFFAGHGDVSPAGEGFLVLADGPFTRTDLQEHVVRASPADVNHVVLDACASYFMVRARGETDDAVAPAVPLSPETLDVLRGARAVDAAAWARTGVLVSTSDSAAVHETPALGSGIFSFLLRSALTGGGDANGDGRVEYTEAAAFLSAATADVPDARARLAVHAQAPRQRPHAALTDLTSGYEHFLALPAAGAERVRVLDSRGQPYAEVHHEPGDERLLALVGEPFFVVQVGDREAVLVPRSPGKYALSALPFAAAAKERGFGTGLPARFLDARYGRSYLAGFAASADMVAPAPSEPMDVAWAEAGAPPAPLPLRPAAIGAFVGTGVLAAASLGLAVANLVAFGALDQDARQTGQIDPGLALQVEAFRAGSVAAGAGALVVGLAGAGLWLWADAHDEEEPWR